MYLRGESIKGIVENFKCSLSGFWNVVRGLQLEAAENRRCELSERIRTMSDVEKGWVAGIVDGEGYIGLVNNSPGITPRVDVSSTTPPMQQKLLCLIGGYFGHKDRKLARPTRKPLTTWSLWSAETVGPFLEIIGPLLVVKGRMAEVVLSFCHRRQKNRCEEYTSEDWKAVEEIRRLNRRGR